MINLPTLQARRLRGDMIETFKLLHGFEDVDPSMFFTRADTQHTYRTRLTSVVDNNTSSSPPLPSFGLLKKKYKLELRGNFFSQRVVAP